MEPEEEEKEICTYNATVHRQYSSWEWGKKQKRFQTVVELEESDKDARNMCKLNSILHIKTPVAQVWSRSVGHQLISSGC